MCFLPRWSRFELAENPLGAQLTLPRLDGPGGAPISDPALLRRKTPPAGSETGAPGGSASSGTQSSVNPLSFSTTSKTDLKFRLRLVSAA